jgi:4-amino-4-deoxy-L-arabinose transferase-like glycosyltransferase
MTTTPLELDRRHSARAYDTRTPFSLSAIACLLIITAVWAAVYVPGLASPGLLDDADSVHASAARHMAETGDYVTLYANGIRYLEKAPLTYWAVALTYKLFGVSEWTTRLHLAIAALALAYTLFFLGRRVYGRAGGFLSGLVIVTAIGPYLFTRFMLPDLVVGLWLAIIAHLFLMTLEQDRPERLYCWGIAALTALTVLTKGLIGVVFPVATIFLFLLIRGDLRRFFRMHLVSSFFVFIAVAVPWHWLAAIRNPPAGEAKGFLWFYFINEQWNRYLDKRIPRDYDKVPLLIFLAMVLLWAVPWSVYLPKALVRLRSFVRDRARDASLYFAVWAAVVIVFFCFSTRQEYYTIPAIPALALLIGGTLGREFDLNERKSWAADLLGLLGVVIAAVTFYLAIGAKPPAPGRELYEALTSNPEVYARSLGHASDLTHEALGFLKLPLVITGISALVGFTLHAVLRRWGKLLAAHLVLAAGMCGIFYAVHLALIQFTPILGSKEAAVAIQNEMKPGDMIVLDGEFTIGSSVNVYTGKQLYILNGRINGLWYGSLFPDAPKIFLDDNSFGEVWRTKQRVFFFTKDRNRREFLERFAPAQEMFHSGGKYVFTN